MSGYDLKRPCAKCPFRADVPGFLRVARVTEIEQWLARGEFYCHETIDYSGDGDEPCETERSNHCAGALILLEKLGRPSQMMRIAERLGLYDRTKLDMEAPVFDSFSAMRRAQEKPKP